MEYTLTPNRFGGGRMEPIVFASIGERELFARAATIISKLTKKRELREKRTAAPLSLVRKAESYAEKLREMYGLEEIRFEALGPRGGVIKVKMRADTVPTEEPRPTARKNARRAKLATA